MKNFIGGGNEWSNIDIVRYVCQEVDKEHDRGGDDTCESLINFFKDLPGHNR
jgi:dTDP-glucose 4,6-dehydratase